MADTFTPNFDLVLPEIGGSLDTWGAKLNENFSEVDDRLIPSGLIAMWSGSVGAVPGGWALCDGTNGTPDLRNRFIVGAGGSYAEGATGGVTTVTLTKSQIPSHNHSASTGSSGSHNHSGTANSAGNHTHSASASTDTHSHGGGSVNGSIDSTGSSTFRMMTGATTTGGNSGTLTGFRTDSDSHSHSISINSNGAHTHSLFIVNNGAHTHSVSVGNTGGDGSHENRPPYYALAYIMKL